MGEYLLGEFDFYEVLENRKRTTQIQSYNLRVALN